ncbi:hypothetical protein NHH82_02185 [Oxalobacteraceae bacterium OTU3REALA1]|nr:hypothetical protein NHH82_02185 [Oxalobacteraceae bacterium OTU3REALA1]
MKKTFFLVGVLAIAGCASNVQHRSLAADSVAGNRTATVTPKDAIFSDIPLKPMTASQSAARMN